MDFSAHANYTFEIESLNGVSDMSSFARQVAVITVITDQGGEYVLFEFYLTLVPNLIFKKDHDQFLTR